MRQPGRPHRSQRNRPFVMWMCRQSCGQTSPCHAMRRHEGWSLADGCDLQRHDGRVSDATARIRVHGGLRFNAG